MHAICKLAVYIAFIKDNKVLLSKRKNTGYKDGFYSFVSGHVEIGEGVVDAALREAKEEVGVDISIEHLEFSLVCNNRVDNPYTDYFFVCKEWLGEISNMEDNKCECVEWFNLNKLPKNTTFQVKEYIKAYDDGIRFKELK